MDESLLHGLVRVHELGVLPHHRDPDSARGRICDPLHDAGPFFKVGGRRLNAEEVEDHVVEPLSSQLHGHLVDRADVPGLDDAADRHIREEGDLLLDALVQRVLGAADENVRLDSNLHELPDGVLGRLGLELTYGGDVRDEGQVDEDGVLAPFVLAELPDGLQERQALDVADRAADLRDDHVVVVGEEPQTALDLIGDMRDDLNGGAQVLALALLGDDVLVYAARGDVVGLR